MHPRLNAPVRVARQFARDETAADPSKVLAIDAVAFEGSTHGADEGHTPVTQPTIHVFLRAAHVRDDSANARLGFARRDVLAPTKGEQCQ